MISGRHADLSMRPLALLQRIARRGESVCTGARMIQHGLSAVCRLRKGWLKCMMSARQGLPVHAPAMPAGAGAKRPGTDVGPLPGVAAGVGESLVLPGGLAESGLC